MGRNIPLVAICLGVLGLVGFFIISCKEKANNHKVEIVELGRHLFYDRRLSVNNTKACATCHNPDFAFTDGYKRSLGVFADMHQRNTQPLFNISSYKYLTAADSGIHSTLQQMNNPLFNEHPKEMGVKGHEKEILERISSDQLYKKLFAGAYSSEKNYFNWANIKNAISEFIHTIISDSSAYDKYISGNKNALSASQKNGMQLFFSDNLKCASCHGGANFSTPSITNSIGDTIYYFNTGLYNIDARGGYPYYDRGLYQQTHNDADMGKFRVPTLRNLAFTAPYFHDGSASNLREIIDIYTAGGRIINEGINAGNGIKNPFKHPFIKGFSISENEKIDLLNFLQSLTDSSLIHNNRYSNPFVEDETKKKY